MRHIVDEFIRVALAFPEVFFSLTSNGQQVFHLERGSLKQRIIQLLGAQYNSRLVSVQEQTDYLNISGFVGKPDTAKKTRGDQYFFVNNRFIKSGYLNHAVMNAFQEMIPGDSFPLYVLFIDLDPTQVDVNVHPTKQEIKFEDEKIVYAFVQAAVKHALAQFSITPTLDFDLDPTIQSLDAVTKPFSADRQSAVTTSSIYQSFTQKNQAHKIEPVPSSPTHWDQYFDPAPVSGSNLSYETITPRQVNVMELQTDEHQDLTQLLQSYIIAPTNRGFILINQQLAHERVLYEQYLETSRGKPVATQRSLFPSVLELSTADAVLLNELLEDFLLLGYLIEPFGKDSFVIQGTPADVVQGNEKNAIELVIEQIKHFSNDVKFSKREKLIRSMATQQAIRPGQPLSITEMRRLVEDLFNCLQPNMTASGAPTFIEFKREYLDQLFRKS